MSIEQTQTLTIPTSADAKQNQAITNVLKVMEDAGLITVTPAMLVTADEPATLTTLNKLIFSQKPPSPGRGTYTRNTYRNPATGQVYSKKEMDALLETENGIKPGFQFAHSGDGMLEVFRHPTTGKLALRKA